MVRNGRRVVVRLFPLTEEMENVEWLPGAIVLLTQEELKEPGINSPTYQTLNKIIVKRPEFYYNSKNIVKFPEFINGSAALY